MIRAAIVAVEEWVMDDESMFIGANKLLFVIAVGFGLIFGPIIYLADRHEAAQPHFTLRKDEWNCAQSHSETHMVFVGKVFIPQTIEVCDAYLRK